MLSTPCRDGKALLAENPKLGHSLQRMKTKHFENVDTPLPQNGGRKTTPT